MLNVTKYEGETVRIRCEITGFPLPRYRWRHNGVLIPDSSDAERGRRDVKTTPWGSRWEKPRGVTDPSIPHSHVNEFMHCATWHVTIIIITGVDLLNILGGNPNWGKCG